MIFGIMGAMPDEVDQLCAKLENVTVEPYGGVEYHKGTLAGKQVVVCCAGMGKANAAATTQVLITKFGAEKIIFSGIAGNMTSKIGIGDVVIGKTVLYHDAQLDMFCQNPPFLKEYTGDPELIAAGVDALIVQDMALRRMNLPVELHASTQAATRTPEQALFLERCGFEAEDFGGGDVLIRQIPSDVDVEDAKALLQELAGKLLAGKTLDPNGLRDELLHSIACKSAIKAGWQTSDEELRRLVQEVLSRDDIKYCPHGRPVCVTLTKRQLEKQFKRV